VVRQMPVDAVFQWINKKELFRLSWGAKNAHGERWLKLEADFEIRLEQMRKEAIQKPWLHHKGYMAIGLHNQMEMS